MNFGVNENESETLEVVRKAYEEAALSSIQVYQWQKNFMEGQEGLEEKQ